MKFLKVTIKAKKDHPETPEPIVFYTSEFKFAKDAIEVGKQKLVDMGEDSALWFNPKAEQSTKEFFDAWKERQGEATSEESDIDSQAIYDAIFNNEDVRDLADGFGGIEVLADKITLNFENACKNLAKNESVDIPAMLEKMNNFIYATKLAKFDTMNAEVQKFIITSDAEDSTVEEFTLAFWCAGAVLFGGEFNHEDEMEASEAEILASGQSDIEDEVAHFNIAVNRVSARLGDVEFSDIDDKLGFISSCLVEEVEETALSQEQPEMDDLTDNQRDAIDAIMAAIGSQSSDESRTRELSADIISEKVINSKTVKRIAVWFEKNKAGIIGTAAANRTFLSGAIDTAISQKDEEETKSPASQVGEDGFYWFQYAQSFGFGMRTTFEDGTWVGVFDFGGRHNLGSSGECKTECEAIATCSGVAIGYLNELMKTKTNKSVIGDLKRTISGIGSRDETVISEAKCEKGVYEKNISQAVIFPKESGINDQIDAEEVAHHLKSKEPPVAEKKEKQESKKAASKQVEKTEVDEDVSLEDLGLSSSDSEVVEFKNELSPVELFNEKLPALVADGVHIVDDMKNEIYHAVDGISSSKIKDARKSLMYFNNKHNLGLVPRAESPAFALGSVTHSMTLEPENTKNEFVKSEKFDKRIKQGKEDAANFAATNQGKEIIDPADWDLAELMTKAVYDDKDAATILNHPARRSERSWFKTDESTGLLVKVRPDIELGSIIGDLKTISMRGMPDEEKIIQKLRYEILDRGYDLSAAMYLDVTGKRDFVWIFVNKMEGYHWVAVIKASEETLNNGHTKYRESLDKIKQAYDSNHWPKPEPLARKRNPENGKLELAEI